MLLLLPGKDPIEQTRSYHIAFFILQSYWHNLIGLVILAAVSPFLEDLDPTYFLIKELFPGLKNSLLGKVIRSIVLLIIGFHWVVCTSSIVFYVIVLQKIVLVILDAISSNQKISPFSRQLEKTLNGATIKKLTPCWNPSSFNTQLMHYRKLFILVGRSNCNLRWTHAVGFISGSFLFIISGACGIWFYGSVPVTTLMLFPGFIFIMEFAAYFISGPAGLIREHSTNILNRFNSIVSITSPTQVHLMRRILKSLQPVRIEFGPFFRFVKATGLILNGIWIEKTITLLLVMKAKYRQ